MCMSVFKYIILYRKKPALKPDETPLGILFHSRGISGNFQVTCNCHVQKFGQPLFLGRIVEVCWCIKSRLNL